MPLSDQWKQIGDLFVQICKPYTSQSLVGLIVYYLYYMLMLQCDTLPFAIQPLVVATGLKEYVALDRTSWSSQSV